MRNRRLLSTLLASFLVLASTSLLAGAGIASAAAAGAPRFTCSGHAKQPGVLAGTYSDVVVRGVCVVNSGSAYVQRDLVVAPGATLLAAFARDRTTRGGSSSLTVGGSLTVLRGGTLILGCEAAHFACIDDPNQKNPTLNSSSSVGGNLTVTGLRSCWFGALRNNLRNSALVAGNTMADPDAMEVVSNTVRHSLSCLGNSPAVQYGDSVGTPNVVRRWATGECGFNVFQPNPARTKTSPAGPLTPISVRARHHHHH